MRRILVLTAVAVAGFYFCSPSLSWRALAATTQGRAAAPARPADDAAALELKRQQLAEKEASLKAKEQSLNQLSTRLDAETKELNAARKGLEGSLATKKKQDDERYKKMLKILKGLKPDDAAALLNKLDAKMAIGVMNQLDQKTAIKLIPLITQPRVLEWTRENLSGK